MDCSIKSVSVSFKLFRQLHTFREDLSLETFPCVFNSDGNVESS